MRPPAGGPGHDAITPRIFQIGFNKCGTRTFYDFFEKNGIKSVHYKRGDLARGIAANIEAGKPPLEGWDKWIAYTDMQWVKKTGVVEACGFYKEFAAWYPRSFFILNTRDKDRWIKSRLNHGTNQNYGERYRQGLGLATMEETIDAWSAMWDRHHEEVAKFFAETGQHFLLYNIEQDTPDKLVEFLAPGFRTDAAHFGHEGKTAATPTDPPKPKRAMEEAATPYVTRAPDPDAGKTKQTDAPSVTLSRRFIPRNDLVSFDESVVQDPFHPAPIQPAREGWTGNLIVSVVRDEGPFLLEWIAHHRAVGFNHFLIFSHDCSDGTDAMLDRLEEMGIVTHVALEASADGSAQAMALEDVMRHPVVFEADWITCIEPDEFVNIRTGNGTLDCLKAKLPGNVTNIAMTWRIFGSAGVVRFEDGLTTAHFDRCAPSYLPKPFAAWGFKTLTSNIGAYQSLGAHRPGDLLKDFAQEVKWVNGSGVDITKDRAKGGWRSDVKTVGYDLVQLNRYPLRSLEAFLLRRERVAEGKDKPDLESWIALDWNSHSDLTIQRNLPRMQAELDQLKQDATLAEVHSAAIERHQKLIKDIKSDPEAIDFEAKTKAVMLDDVARVARLIKSG